MTLLSVTITNLFPDRAMIQWGWSVYFADWANKWWCSLILEFIYDREKLEGFAGEFEAKIFDYSCFFPI